MGINDGVLIYYSLAEMSQFNCAVLTVCTLPMNTRTLTATGRRHNEGVIRWNNILRNLASRKAGRMILMDIEH